MPAESLLYAPVVLVGLPSLHRECSPTTNPLRDKSAASVVNLSPVKFSAQARLTSELLRTL
jgi:hypothetical protein